MKPVIEFILYCSDQENSTRFYQKVLQKEPVLNVPGMTEFLLADNVKLGLMPEAGIAKILGDKMPHPASGNGIPRCELYLFVADLEAAFESAVKAGANIVSEISLRNWGDEVGYVADLDGHIIAFARKMV